MRALGILRLPLGEVSPNIRSRIVGARDYGIKFAVIGRKERLSNSTIRTIYKNASYKTSCIT